MSAGFAKKLENIGLENYIATKVGMGYMIV